jgi:hypothetical protein
MNRSNNDDIAEDTVPAEDLNRLQQGIHYLPVGYALTDPGKQLQIGALQVLLDLVCYGILENPVYTRKWADGDSNRHVEAPPKDPAPARDRNRCSGSSPSVQRPRQVRFSPRLLSNSAPAPAASPSMAAPFPPRPPAGDGDRPPAGQG